MRGNLTLALLFAFAVYAVSAATDLSGPLFLGLLPPKCYDAILVNFQIDIPCISFAISKGLGYAIIAGAFMLKVPQILSIIRNKSAESISASALYLDSLSYAATAAYNMHTGTPVSTYAETVVIFVQNLIIIALVWHYSGTAASHRALVVAAGVAAIAALAGAPSSLLSLFIPLSMLTTLSSRAQQIYANFSAGSTGMLSLPTTILQTGGCAARVFTTLAEVDDPIVLGSFLVAFALNAIVLGQIIYYGGTKQVVDLAKETAAAAADKAKAAATDAADKAKVAATGAADKAKVAAADATGKAKAAVSKKAE